MIRFGHKKEAFAVIEKMDEVFRELGYPDKRLAENIQQKIWEIRNGK